MISVDNMVSVEGYKAWIGDMCSLWRRLRCSFSNLEREVRLCIGSRSSTVRGRAGEDESSATRRESGRVRDHRRRRRSEFASSIDVYEDREAQHYGHVGDEVEMVH